MADERELIAEREKKAAEIRALGRNPYANGFAPTHAIGDVVARFAGRAPPPPATGGEHGGGGNPELLSDDKFTVAGRIIAYRGFGKAAFVKIMDHTGEIQVWVK